MKKDWMIKVSDLDATQETIFNAVLDKPCVVMGCAGSGKSVIAILKAQRIEQENEAKRKRGEKEESVQTIVFTKSLRKYISSGHGATQIPQSVYHYDKWKIGKPSSDYVIVDEIQDFEKSQIEEFIRAKNKVFFFFGDTAQSIYDGIKNTISVENLAKQIEEQFGGSKFDLFYNYRLPVKIARFAQEFGVGLPEFDPEKYKSTEPTMPYVDGFNNLDEQVEFMVKIINNDLEDVAVLVPYNAQVLTLQSKLNARFKEVGMSKQCEIKYRDDNNWHNNIDTLNFNTTNVKILTYHSAKGLQFETVFLPAVEGSYIDDISRRKAFYVAMTRTYKDLYIMYSSVMPQRLRVNSTLYQSANMSTNPDLDWGQTSNSQTKTFIENRPLLDLSF